jgi:hypothetical protein
MEMRFGCLALVRADDLRREAAVVEQRHRDFVGILDHMEVGDDVAVLRVDDHAGACALKRPLMGFGVRGHIEELSEERIVQQRVALSRLLLDGAARGDIDHRRGNPLDHGCERGHRRRIGRGRCRRADGGKRRRCGHAEREHGRRQSKTQIHARSFDEMVRRAGHINEGPDDESGPSVTGLEPAILHRQIVCGRLS